MGTKKKDSIKLSQFIRSTDNEDEIRAELEAMTNLDYVLHSDLYDPEYDPEGKSTGDPAPLSSTRKFRAAKESSKHDHRAPAMKSALTSSSSTTSTRNMEKTSKLDNESHMKTYVPQASIKELHNLICQAAASSEDKYKILEARDRLMRLRRSKSHEHLSVSRVTRGTCPDMCPEKERLMRESQRQVAAYELLDGASDYRINHETAVKQYSRSSADQEEPLPQDLRPVESLKMTMSYLLHEIADLCEQSGVNLAEWYHFLWDRTRGIRKDITQQELCCPDSVQLVEQCARFHIVCAERLCAEEVSVFDKKINTENLTKCLQTLKYMYNDLRVKGIRCQNEPEFRAYIVLLNLNDGNFMWDVQRLPALVQKSPEVRFAIEVYSCVESNNYAKFFRLVRVTTYLNACILLRYFNQVRAKALSVMVKAYCRTASTAFPLYELIDILGFEDENEAVLFCEHVGLNLTNDELGIVLNRRNFCQPMSNVEQGRACINVESKRTSAGLSIGLCIAGQKMPEKSYRGHRPHDSFDSRGYLKSESICAKDQNGNGVGGEDETENFTVPERHDDPYEYTAMDEDASEPSSKIFSSSALNKMETEMDTMPSSPHRRTRTNDAYCHGLQEEEEEEEDDDEEEQGEDEEDEDDEEEENSASGFDAAPVNEKLRESEFEKERTKSSQPMIHVRDFGGFGNARSPGILATREPFSRELRDGSVPGNSATGIFGNIGIRPTSIFAGSICGPASSLGEKNFGTSIFGGPSSGNIFGNAGLSSSMLKSEPQGEGSTMSATKITIIPTTTKDRDSATSASQDNEKEESSDSRDIDLETKDVYAELLKEVTEDYCDLIAREETELARRYDDSSERILDELLEEYTNENCREILDTQIYTRRKIDELSKRVKNSTVLKYYKIWRQFTRRKRQQRRALEQTPVWVQKRSLEECAKSLYREDQRLAIDNMKIKRRRKMSNEDDRWLHRLGYLEYLEHLEPIESKIYEGIRENARILDTRLPSYIYWKMIISWPSMENHDGIISRYKRIMDEYACPGNTSRVPTVESYRPNSYETLYTSVQSLEGFSADENAEVHQCLSGTDGLFFVATTHEAFDDVVRRLTSLIFSRNKLMPVPVFVAILGEAESFQRTELDDRLDRLIRSGYVSEYTIHRADRIDEKLVLNLIQNATLWLTINKSPSVPLEMDYLSKLAEDCLAEELWLRIIGDSSYNERLEIALRNAEFVIRLHNEAVAHLIDIVLDPESLMYTDFPNEFQVSLKSNDVRLPCGYELFDSTWKKEENRARLERIMNSLLLPEWTFGWPIEDAVEFEKCLIRYCEQSLGEDPSRSIETNPEVAQADTRTNFVQVLLEIVKEKIDRLDPRAKAVYNKNHVKHFRNSPWWFKSGTLANYPVTNLVSKTVTIVEEAFLDIQEEKRNKNEIEEIVSRYEQSVFNRRKIDSSLTSFRREAKKSLSELEEISARVERTLAEQKSRCRLLDDKLSLALGAS